MLRPRPCREVVRASTPVSSPTTPIRPWVSWPDLVKAWGDRALTLIELEERIATAAEKAPTDDAQIRFLREAIA